MAARGRPVGSRIRQNIVDILYFLKRGYGYQIHKIYKQLFDSITSEVVYYHLRRGVDIEEFEIDESKNELGNFSWGNTVKKHYYRLGKAAKPSMNKKIKEYLEKENLIK